MSKTKSPLDIVLRTVSIGIIIAVVAVVFQALESPPIYYKILLLILIADGIIGLVFFLEWLFETFSGAKAR